jgi:phosphoribosylamine--glycine ligase
MNVLLIGSGGREHALAWKIAQSPRLTKLFAAPGNPGIAEHAELAAIDVSDHAAVVGFCRGHAIDLVVVGPEGPLVAGIVDDLAAAGIAAFGPSREAARLEGSKAYTKAVCDAAGIPTAAYRHFTSAAQAVAYAKAAGAPVVVKADGLAAGKGVTIAATVAEATEAIEACFAGAHGAAGAEVVIEEYLVGEEASFFVLSDGENVVPLATAQDHKRAHDGDTGPNTGGMGAYSPAPAMTPVMIERTLTEIVRPTIAAMAARGALFRGVLYAGLMLTADGPKLIEYNVRFGDPEAQVLMMRLDSDLLPLLLAAATGSLAGAQPKWSSDAALTVVMAARGYPVAYAQGSPIAGVARANALPGVKVFHAGTARSGATLVSAGGRVLDVTARAATIREAQMRAYDAVAHNDWPDGVFRRDIGRRAVISRG